MFDSHRTDPMRAMLMLASGALVLIAALVPPSPAPAQVPAPSPALTGTWQLHGTVAEAHATVQAAIGPAVASLTPDIRRMARARIAESTAVPSTIEIQARPDHIHLAFTGEDNHTFESEPGGSQNVYSRSGVRAQLTQTYRPDGGIEQRFRAIDGTQWNFLSPQPDGQTLHLDVLMRSRRLTQDVRFRLVFRRTS